MSKLKNKIQKAFTDHFGSQPTVMARAPGRINIIGEHTDYNLGLVLPASIDKYMFFALKANGSRYCNIKAIDIEEEVILDLGSCEKGERIWVNYLLGIVRQFQLQNIEIGGFDCVFGGDIPIGSGLSSSAALDCGFIAGLNQLFKANLDQWQIVTMSNQSNNHFLNIQSGILDQFASVFGKKDHCMMLDCRSRVFEYYNLSLTEYQFVLINTNVRHENATSGYNDRPAECREIVALIKPRISSIESLRDITMSILETNKDLLSNQLYNRAKFIIEENERVHNCVSALKNGDIQLVGQLLYQSHYGLQHLYKVSCKELDILVELTQEHDEVIGSRMMGGGFGGCTLNLIHKMDAKRVVEEITRDYKIATIVNPDVYWVRSCDGVRIF